MDVVDCTKGADLDLSAAPPLAGPAVRRRLERWINNHPSLDGSADRFGWVGGEPLEPAPDNETGAAIGTGTDRPRWDRVAPPPDLDLTPAETSTGRADFDLLHIIGDASIEPGSERAARIGRYFRSVRPDRYLAISVAADGPGGDPGRLNRDLLDGTSGRVVLEHLELAEPASKDRAGRPWLTVVVRCLR